MKPTSARGLVVAGTLVASAFVAGCDSGGTFDPGEDELERALTEQVGVPVTVTCPDDIPLKAGHITDCVADDGQDRKYVRITQDDNEGHYTWELTSQDAP